MVLQDASLLMVASFLMGIPLFWCKVFNAGNLSLDFRRNSVARRGGKAPAAAGTVSSLSLSILENRAELIGSFEMLIRVRKWFDLFGIGRWVGFCTGLALDSNLPVPVYAKA